MGKVQKAHVPALRFPGFSGEWVEKRLGEVAKFSKGKGISKSDIVENGITKCIRYGELYTHYNELIKSVISRTNLPIKELTLSKKNDVIIPASGETQIDIATASCVLEDGIALSGDLNIIRSNENGVFLSYTLNNAQKYNIARLAQGVSVVHLYASQLASLKLHLPTLPEQEKIAAFLSSIDARVEGLRKKCALLKEYKRGVMQHIFSRNIRFKDDNGNPFPDWEEKRLGEVGNVKGGKRIPKGFSLQDIDNGHPYITVSDMENGSVSLSKLRYVPDDVVKIIRNYTISTKDIYVSVAGTLGLVGKIPKELEGANLTENADKITKLRCSQDYLLHCLKSDNFQKFIKSVQTNNAQPKLSIYALQSFLIRLPTLPEQQKIATFLSTLDDKIATTEKELEQTKAYKKGLLQKMFV